MAKESQATEVAGLTVENKDGVIVIKKGDDVKLTINASNDDVTVRTPGNVNLEPVVQLVANGETPSVVKRALEVGDKAEDGSIYAGTVNGYKVFAAPLDLTNDKAQHLTLTFNDAAAWVKYLNDNKYLGHTDWMIPESEVMGTVQANKDKGFLKESFQEKAKLTNGDAPAFYWTATQQPGYLNYVIDVRLSDGKTEWLKKDAARLSTRPVRLVKV